MKILLGNMKKIKLCRSFLEYQLKSILRFADLEKINCRRSCNGH